MRKSCVTAAATNLTCNVVYLCNQIGTIDSRFYTEYCGITGKQVTTRVKIGGNIGLNFLVEESID